MYQTTLRTSPSGIAIYPYLRTPNTYNNQEVGFSVNLQVTPEQAEEFQQMFKDEIQKALNSNDPEFKNKRFTNPILPILQKEDGTFQIKFKSNSSYTNKNGENIKRNIPIYSASLEKLDDSVDVGYGSIIKISYRPKVYYISTAMHGVKLLIEAVQVINLVTKGERNADYYGFVDETQKDYSDFSDYSEPNQ